MPELEPIRPVPPTVRDMNLEKNRLPSTQGLAGETITLRYDDGVVATLWLGAENVGWAIEDENGAQTGDAPYDAVEIRPGLFFLHFATPDRAIGLSHVIDRPAGRAVVGWDDASGTPLRRHVRTARIDGHDGAYTPIPESRELIGRRAYCEYSEEAALEHVYVNSAAVLWQWLLLPDDPRFALLKTEIGVEAISMRKVQDDLFLLTLNDGGPVGLTLLMDFAQKRNVGVLFGRTPTGLISRPVGARIVLLNRLSYPSGYEPG